MLTIRYIKYSVFLIAVFKESSGRFSVPTNVAQTKHGGSCLASIKSDECTKALDGFVTHNPAFKWGFHGWPNNTWFKSSFDDAYKIGQLRFMQMYYAEECNFQDLKVVFTNGTSTTEIRLTLAKRNNAYDLEIFDMNPPIIASSVNITVQSVYILSRKVYSGFMEIEVIGIDASLPWPKRGEDTEVISSNNVTQKSTETIKTTTNKATPLAANQESDNTFNIMIVYGSIIGGLVLIILIILVIVILLYRKSRRKRRLDEIDNDVHNIAPLEELRLRRENEISLKNGADNSAVAGIAIDNNVYTNNEDPNLLVQFYSGNESRQIIGKETRQPGPKPEEKTNNLIASERRNIITKEEKTHLPMPVGNQHKPLKRLNENKMLTKSPSESSEQINFADALRTALNNRSAQMDSRNINREPVKTEPTKSNIKEIMAQFDNNQQIDKEEGDYVNVPQKHGSRNKGQKGRSDYVNVKKPGDTETQLVETSESDDDHDLYINANKKRNQDYINVKPHSRIN